MYTPEITRFADDVAANEFRLDTADIRELNMQMNVNTIDPSDGGDEWFDNDPEYRSDIREIDESEFFDRFVF
jgi:hypothetical protein